MLSFTPSTHGTTSPRKIIIEKVKSKLMRLLDLSSGGFPMILNNHVAFDQLKSLLNELCDVESSAILPPELKMKFQEFLETFVSKAKFIDVIMT